MQNSEVRMRNTRSRQRGQNGVVFFLPLFICAGPLGVHAANVERNQNDTAPIKSMASKSRLGMNLAGVGCGGTDLAFVNIFRNSRLWISNQKGQPQGKGPKLDLDEHGWVKRLDPDCWVENPFDALHCHAPAGEYVVLYDGEGEIDIYPEENTTVSSTPGRIVFTPKFGKGFTFVRIKKTNPENYIRNIRVIMPGFEKTYLQEPFHPAFLARWKDFHIFRFMDWMHTNNSPKKEWAERPKLEDANWSLSGVPIEVMVDLCNRLKIHPWFCMPHQCTDDYVKQFALYIKEHLDPTLKAHVEYSNEMWNNVFPQAKYIWAKGTEAKIPGQPWEAGAKYFARRSVEIFRIWEETLGGRERLVRVIAWQAGANEFWTDKTILSFEDAHKNCDALAIAPYLTFCVPGKTKTPDGLIANEVASWNTDQLMDYIEEKALPKSVKWMGTQKQIASKYNLKLLAYEGGLSCTPFFGQQTKLS